MKEPIRLSSKSWLFVVFLPNSYNTMWDSPPPDDRSSLCPVLKPALIFSSFNMSLQPVPSRWSPLWCRFSGPSWRSLGWWERSLGRPLVRLAALWGGSGSFSPGPDRQSSGLPAIVWLSVGADRCQKETLSGPRRTDKVL